MTHSKELLEAELLEENVNNSIPEEVMKTEATETAQISVKIEAPDALDDPNIASKSNSVLATSPKDVSKSNKTDDGSPPTGDVTNKTSTEEEEMEVDDPEIFGPFAKSQLEPSIQTEADQGHFDSFKDNMSLLKTAIGKF